MTLARLVRLASTVAAIASSYAVGGAHAASSPAPTPSTTGNATEPTRQPWPVEEDDCGCYVTNGTDPTYYSKRIFFDFRDLGKYADQQDDVETDADKARGASPSSKYFKESDWKKTWKLSDWTKGIDDDNNPLTYGEHVARVYSPGNVYVESDDDSSERTYVSVRSKRVPDFQSCGEFSSADEYQYLSLRVLARTVGDPGGVTSIFTYREAKELADVQEADIEFLTQGADDRVQYVNNPAYTLEGQNFPEATRDVEIPHGRPFSDWLVHRLDWTPRRSTWYVDGNQTAAIAFQVPRDPSHVVFNVWSDGGYWSGNMSMGGQVALQIQWIEMVYNTTKEDEGGCGAVCSIDEDETPGSILMLWDNGESGSSRPSPWLPLWATVAVVVVVVAWHA